MEKERTKLSSLLMEAFYREWIQRLDQIFTDLISPPREEGQITHLINRALAHYKSYYQERRRLAEHDVLQAFSAPWMTSFEQTFLWVGGWRPSLTFRLLAAVSGEETAAVRDLREETAAEEDRLSRELAGLQEIMAAPAVAAVVERVAELRNGMPPPEQDEVVGAVLRSLRVLLERADDLRVKVVKGLVRILSPEKMLELVTSATSLHLRLHSWGTRLEA